MAGIGITGWGSCLPEGRLTNGELAARFGVDEDWIVQRTGIRERRIVGPGETTASLAVEAGRRALARAGLRPDQISHLILASGTPEQLSPATSAFVQRELGTAGGAHDVNAECAGFAYGFVVAAGLMAIDPRPILLIGTDTHSLVVNPEDRDLGVLIGDGAGAVVLTPHDRSWLRSWDMGCDGTKVDSLRIPAGGSRLPASEATLRNKQHYAQIKGNEIYLNAVRFTVGSVKRTLRSADLEPGDIDHLLPHQANMRIIDSILERSRVPRERLITNIEYYGNTGAASMPIALAEALDAGRIQRGDRVLFAAFGAGMVWLTALVEWGAGEPVGWTS
ncbi:3-oxoacyl-ACP synthase III family protein [Streptomyces qinzhouensis]|uniref:Ketoacyl-ACP synthase III n=1 Tax=Streptomyces qinzhouensis TaxID=2599401 RepID=A0A5B8IB32_9ACTN|nr:ketoacyl-ACP synthase III [Streptomyces qinzhouensis]QDY75228.1 ketoacyl-ACP synthase III [Streptomyces qinzhouensis]QDY80570.1 ketoacyl-ACP synthase III [Streptomyces qinzhouensis]